MGENEFASLIGHWVHSHEEDRPGQMVFRRKGFDFPRARGRAGFELRPGDVWMDHPIAPGDGNLQTEGKWKLTAPDELCLQPPAPKGVARVLRLVAVEPDRLVVAERV